MVVMMMKVADKEGVQLCFLLSTSIFDSNKYMTDK